MTGTPISGLPNATTPLSGSEAVPIVQNGETVQAPSATLGIQGPGSVTDGYVALFSGTTGRLLKAATPGQLPGTTTNDNAAAGNIGEYISAAVLSGSPVSLTGDTPVNITSISLTAGDWDVRATIGFIGASSTTVNYMMGSMSTTTGTPDATNGRQAIMVPGGITIFAAVPSAPFPVGTTRFSLAVTTTIYLVASSGFATSTNGGFGFISARRVR